MVEIKKFIIFLILALFIINAAYAFDIEKTADIEINDDVNEIVEVTKIDGISLAVDDIDNSEIIFEDSNYQGHNDSNIIKTYESFEVEEVENFNQYNYTYIEDILNHTLSDHFGYSLNNTAYVSFHIFNNFLNNYEVFICMKLDAIFKTKDFSRCIFKFYEYKEFNIITHDVLAFYNDYCYVLTHAVNEDIIQCSDKLNTNAAFSIDNSIVGLSNNLSTHVFYSNLILIFNSMSFFQNLSTSTEYLFKNFYLNECVYSFFSVFNNRMNEVYSFRV